MSTSPNNRDFGAGADTTDAVLVINENNCAAPVPGFGGANAGDPTTAFSCGGGAAAAPDGRFQDPQFGVLAANNRLEWNGIHIPIPGGPSELDPSVTDCAVGVPNRGTSTSACNPLATTMRITGMRANPSQLGVPDMPGVPVSPVTASVSITGPNTLPVNNSVLNVGIPQTGLLVDIDEDDAALGLQCEEGEGHVTFEIAEFFATAFRPLGVPTFTPGNTQVENGYPAPGSGAVTPPGDGGATQGGATQATSFLVRFFNIPEGVRVSMEKVPDCVPGTSPGNVVEVDIDGGLGTIVYETPKTNPIANEFCVFDIWFAWEPDTANDLPAPGTGQMAVTFAPPSTVGTADDAEPEPRFIDTGGDPTTIITISRCPQPPSPPPPPSPRLVVFPDTLSFDLQEGSEPASKPFTVRAINGEVRYSIGPPSSWLSASPEQGVSDGETDTILAIVNPQGLAPGTYSKQFFFRENGVLKRKLEVILNLSPAPTQLLPPPSVPENTVVNAASLIPFGSPGHPVAPGSMVSIFGSNFTDDEHFEAENIPLPFTLGGVSVTLNGLPAALYGVWPDQINAQLPWGLTGSALQPPNAQRGSQQVTSTATLVVENANGSSDPSVVEINTFSPAIFTTSGTGAGQGTVFFANTPDLVAPLGFLGNSRPAKAEDLLTIYANGLGPVDPPIEDGYNSCGPAGDCLPDFSNLVLRGTTTRPVITIGGVLVPDENVFFSGLSPQNVALYQVDVRAPQGLPSGDAVPIIIRIGELESRADVTIAVD